MSGNLREAQKRIHAEILDPETSWTKAEALQGVSSVIEAIIYEQSELGRKRDVNINLTGKLTFTIKIGEQEYEEDIQL